MKIKHVSNTQRMIALADILGWFSLDATKPKIKNITAYKSIGGLPRKEKTCEKWFFSPVINIPSNAIPKY